MWCPNILLLLILNTKSVILPMSFVNVPQKEQKDSNLNILNFEHKSQYFTKKLYYSHTQKNKAERQLRIVFDREEDVTRCKILCFHCILVIFVNLYYILLAKPHAAVRVYVLWLNEGQTLVSFHKIIQKIYAYICWFWQFCGVGPSNVLVQLKPSFLNCLCERP